MSATQKDTNQKTLFIVLIIALLGVVGFLAINQFQQSKKIAVQEEQLDDAERLQLDLERQYYESLSELELQRGSNEELNAMIEAQKLELKAQKDQISAFIKTKQDLSAAKQQITQLKTLADSYLQELDNLKEENLRLDRENKGLLSENTQLAESIEKTRMEKDELASEKSSLLNEKEKLARDNIDLSKKVSRASMIEVTDIKVEGMQIRSSGKERKKSRAASVDRLRICFDLNENSVAESGYERFYIRIINPQGETLAVETLGSGTFINSSTGEQVRYTQIKEVDYDNSKSQACLNWDQDGDFVKGEYTIEVFNKGYLAGKSTFKLK